MLSGWQTFPQDGQSLHVGTWVRPGSKEPWLIKPASVVILDVSFIIMDLVLVPETTYTLIHTQAENSIPLTFVGKSLTHSVSSGLKTKT